MGPEVGRARSKGAALTSPLSLHIQTRARAEHHQEKPTAQLIGAQPCPKACTWTSGEKAVMVMVCSRLELGVSCARKRMAARRGPFSRISPALGVPVVHGARVRHRVSRWLRGPFSRICPEVGVPADQ